MMEPMHKQLPLLSALLLKKVVCDEGLTNTGLRAVLEVHRTGMERAAERLETTMAGLAYRYERTILLLREGGYQAAANVLAEGRSRCLG